LKYKFLFELDTIVSVFAGLFLCHLLWTLYRIWKQSTVETNSVMKLYDDGISLAPHLKVYSWSEIGRVEVVEPSINLKALGLFHKKPPKLLLELDGQPHRMFTESSFSKRAPSLEEIAKLVANLRFDACRF
jgi:hypothetical protein